MRSRGSGGGFFVGDSITQSGGYVTSSPTTWRNCTRKKDFDVLGLGLSSETLSGLSEDGHAGGNSPPLPVRAAGPPPGEDQARRRVRVLRDQRRHLPAA